MVVEVREVIDHYVSMTPKKEVLPNSIPSRFTITNRWNTSSCYIFYLNVGSISKCTFSVNIYLSFVSFIYRGRVAKKIPVANFCSEGMMLMVCLHGSPYTWRICTWVAQLMAIQD